MVADMPPPAAPQTTQLARSRKPRRGTELVAEYGFRPLAHPLVLLLRALRVPPPVVVLAGAATGLVAAGAIAQGELVAAALLLQLKTVLDNADGQLARLTGRVTLLGRYLDSESDLLVNAAVCAGLAHLSGRWWLGLVVFLALTAVLGCNFNVERLYRREHDGAPGDAAVDPTGLERALERVYGVVYAPQDRACERYCAWRLRTAGSLADAQARRAFHDRATVAVIANFGLSTQLLALGACLALGRPLAYAWFVAGCVTAIVLLALRRELLLRQAVARRPTMHPPRGRGAAQ